MYVNTALNSDPNILTLFIFFKKNLILASLHNKYLDDFNSAVKKYFKSYCVLLNYTVGFKQSI